MAPKKSKYEVWKYVTKDGAKLYCTNCTKDFTGSLTRARDHLLGISGGTGGGARACPNVIDAMVADIERELTLTSEADCQKIQKKQRIQEDVSKFTSVSSSSLLKSTGTGAIKQSGTLNSFWKPIEREEVDDGWADYFFTSATPFSSARNPHFRNVVVKTTQFGKGYTPPSSEAFRTTLLKKSKGRVTGKLADIKFSWKATGCTILSDGWSDICQRPLINVLVASPEGVVFLKVIDTMSHKKTSEFIFQILEEAIIEVRVQNAVQVVTDSAENCLGAGKLIVEKYPQFYWSPCAAHCLDLLLHDLAKFPWIHEAIYRGRAVANFIRNHCLTLSLYKQHASRELLRPCDARFASFYITMRRVVKEKKSFEICDLF